MTTQPQPDLIQWLDNATMGLPTSVAQAARAEFEAHYLDAVTDYEAQGQTTLQAHQSALADLGDSQAAARALRQTHLARQRYLRATLVSMAWPIYPFIFFFFGPLLPTPLALNTIIYYSGIVFIVFYSFYTLRSLLMQRFQTDYLGRPLGLMALGAAAYFAPLIFLELFFKQAADPLFIFGPDALAWVAAVGYAVIIGGVVMGCASLWMAYAVSQLVDSLYQLRLSLTVSLGWLGVSMGSFTLALGLQNFLLADLFYTSFFIASFVTFALLSLLFFRAGWRRTDLPIQLA